MPTRRFTVNFFNVRYVGEGPHDSELSETFTEIVRRPPGQRFMDYGNYVDGLANYSSAGGQLRFGELRRYQSHNLPKHGAITAEPTPLPIDDSLVFESAFIFDREISKIGVLRYGGAIFPGRLQEYTNSFRSHRSRVVFDPILRRDAQDRLRSMRLVREADFEFTSHGPDLQGATGATGDLLTLNNGYGAGKIRIIVAVDDRTRGASMRRGLLGGWFEPLKRTIDQTEGYRLERYTVKGRASEDSPIELVDLVEEALKAEVDLEVERSINLDACKRILRTAYLEVRDYLEAYADEEDET